MWSYPNLVPLSGPSIDDIIQTLKPFKFHRIHGAFMDCSIPANGHEVVRRCAERYLKMIRGDGAFEKQ
jgi:hypothetical protein